jgi:AcrR family transcriptional regulator
MSSNSSTKNRATLQPQRDVGRQRVAELLKAASEVIQERGYEATTMAEIAARAGAKIGSLYRFFPGKEAVAEALMRRQTAILQAEFDAIRARAANATPEELADVLIDLFVDLYPGIRAFSALMDARTDRTDVRRRLRAQAFAGIAAALMACAPRLDAKGANAIAAVVMNNMKTMLGMTLKDAPTSPGAPKELRLMNRLYLATRLAPFRETGAGRGV